MERRLYAAWSFGLHPVPTNGLYISPLHHYHSYSPLLYDGLSNPQTYIINSTIMNIKKNINNNKEDDIKLFDNFDWAAMGVAACGIVVFIHLVVMYIRGV